MKKVIAVAILLLAALPLRAQTIANPSFESPATLNLSNPNGPWNTGPIPSWTISGGVAGLWQVVGINEFASVPDGITIAYSNGGKISQDLGAPAQANTIYTLTVWTGRRSDQWETPTNSYTISLSGGATILCTQSAQLSTIPVGTFTKQVLTCPVGVTPPTGNLSVSLGCDGPQCAFDNLSLTSKSAIVPILRNFTIFGGLRYCTLCDKSDDTVTGINLLAGLQVVLTQVDARGQSIGAVAFIMDASGNISGPDNITVNATNPLLFNVAVATPAGVTLGSLAQSIAIDPFHLQGQGSLHVLIRLDKVTPNQIRGVDWFSGA